MNYSTPSKEGLNPRNIIAFLDEAEKSNIELHSLVIIKNGKVVTEGWWKPFSKDKVHQLCSVTKTFTCIAIGFAVNEGLISVDDTLYSFFPEKFPADDDERKKEITIHDLLTMSGGMAKELAISDAADTVKAFFAAEQLCTPGTQFKYNSLGSHMLSEIIYKVTGMQLSEYLKPRLFDPLGIKNVKWYKTPQGTEFGGASLHLTTMDIAKVGLLLLQNGVWEGKQVIPEKWAKTMSEKKIESVPEGPEWLDWAKGYCYQMWCGMQDGSYRLDGAFGQYSMVYPNENMVIAFCAANNFRPLTMRILDKYLFDTIDVEDAEGDKLLAEKMEHLALKNQPQCKRCEICEKYVSGKTYLMEQNEATIVPLSERWFICETSCGVNFVQLDFGKDKCRLVWREGFTTSVIDIGLDGNYRESIHRASCCDRVLWSWGKWEDDSTFCAYIRCIEEVSELSLKFRFEGNNVYITMNETITDFKDKYAILVGNCTEKLAYTESEITFDN